MACFRRIVGLLLAIATLAPGAWAAGGCPEPCDAPRQVAADDHDCCGPAARLCCAPEDLDRDAAIPPAMPRTDAGSWQAHVAATAAPAGIVPAIVRALLRTAPVHGYLQLDLPTLLSTLLI